MSREKTEFEIHQAQIKAQIKADREKIKQYQAEQKEQRRKEKAEQAKKGPVSKNQKWEQHNVVANEQGFGNTLGNAKDTPAARRGLRPGPNH